MHPEVNGHFPILTPRGISIHDPIKAALEVLADLLSQAEPLSISIVRGGLRATLDVQPIAPEPVAQVAAPAQVTMIPSQEVSLRHDEDEPRKHTCRPTPADRSIGEDETRSPTCRQEILHMLSEVGKRMTAGRAQQWLLDRGKEYSASTVEKCLHELKLSGRLDNTKDARGRGYGLTEWSVDADDGI